MGLSRELELLRRRAKTAASQLQVPKIFVDVWHEGEEPPAVKPWQLRIMIETKKDAL